MTKPSPISMAERQADAERFACCAARLLSDNRCEQVLVLDVRKVSPLTDYLVLATGTSDRQINSNIQDLEELAGEMDRSIFRSDGIKGASQWAIIDCLDVMAHLFTAETRSYYDLESLWGDAPHINWHSHTKPGQFAHMGKKPAR
ncbi:MAG: ribosome silencing factor [Phycisphaeraceae bacterium]